MKTTIRRISVRVLTGLFTICALAVSTARATDRDWANTGTDFGTGANWSGGVAPSDNDRAYFRTEASVQPHLAESRTIHSLFFTPASGTSAGSATAAGGGYVLSSDEDATLTLSVAGHNHAGVYAFEQSTTGENKITANLAFPDLTSSNTRHFNVIAGSLELAGKVTGNENNILRFGGSASAEGVIFSGDFSEFYGGLQKVHAYPFFIDNLDSVKSISEFANSIHGTGGAANNRLVNRTGGPLVFESHPRLLLSGGDGMVIESDYPVDFGTNTVLFSDGSNDRTSPLTINAPLVKIGGPTSSTAKNGYFIRGTGTLEVSAPSDYTGQTHIVGAVFLARHAEAFSPLSAVSISAHQSATEGGGVLGLGYGDFDLPLGQEAGCFYARSGGGYSSWGGWAAYDVDRNVNVGGDFQTVTNGVNNFFSRLVLGAVDSDATLNFLNPMCVNHTHFTAIKGSAEVAGRITGVITNYNNAYPVIEKRGNGVLELTADNPLTGTFNLYDGRLRLTGALKTTTNVKDGGGLEGGGTQAHNLTVESGGTLSLNNRLGSLTLNGNLTFNDGAAMEIVLDGSNKAGALFAGAGKTLKNNGDVHVTVVAEAEDIYTGSVVVLDWSNATSPNVSGLNDAGFAVANTEEFSASFSIVGSQLVMNYRNLAKAPTLLLIR